MKPLLLIRHGIFALSLLLLASLAQGQALRGTVYDAATDEPIAQALVRMKGRILGVQTDSLGRFEIRIEKNAATLEVSRLGYQNETTPIPANTGTPLEIRMRPSAALPDVVITAGANLVLEDKTLHLYDYEFMDEGIMVISYDRKRKHSMLAWVDAHDDIITRADTPEPPGKLVRDCMGNVHAITKTHACQLFLDKARDINMYVDSLKTFERFVTPCINSIAPYYYYRFDRFNGQVVDYYHINALNQEATPFLHLSDREKIHQMLDPLGPYVQFASTEEGLLSIPQKTWDEINKLDYEMQFNRLAFFYPIHAPLHVIGNGLVVFDHTNLLIRKLDAAGHVLDSIAITYPKEAHWSRGIIIDAVRQEAYTTFERHGYTTLREIDLRTGALISSTELPKQFAKKIQVRDGVAYFMYKEQEYQDTNRLWRMRLKD